VNLFFRRLWVYLRALLSSKDGAFSDTYTLQFRVWLTDQDAFLHLTNSRYLSFSDLGRLNMLIRSGIWTALNRNDWELVICSQTRTISRMLKSPQTFEMACQITGWTDEHLAICHRFQRSSKVHAEVNTLLRIENRAGNIVPVSELLQQLQITTPSPQLTDVFVDLVERAKSA